MGKATNLKTSKPAAPHRPRMKGFDAEHVTVVAELVPGKREVWAYINSYKGNPLFHIRTVTFNFEFGAWEPAKGLAVAVENRSKVIAGIAAMAKGVDTSPLVAELTRIKEDLKAA